MRGRAKRKPEPYVMVPMPDHPRAVKGRVREHVLIAERALGKFLPDGVEVHHWDRDVRNNDNANLLVCPSHAYHFLIHARMRAFEACGNANWKRCIHCKTYDDPEKMGRRDISSRPEPEFYHQPCNATAAQRWRDGRSA